MHTMVPTCALHIPVSGGVWPVMVGTGLALGSLSVPSRSACCRTGSPCCSRRRRDQPPIGAQKLLAEQVPLRHLALLPLHGPSPSLKPHLLSLSQTTEMHSAAAAQPPPLAIGAGPTVMAAPVAL